MLDRKRGRRSRPHGARCRAPMRSPGAGAPARRGERACRRAGTAGAMGAFASPESAGAETEQAIEVTRTEAILQATVNPHGSETECEFEYGTTEGTLNHAAQCRFKPGHRTIAVPENANLVGLEERQNLLLPHPRDQRTRGKATVKKRSFTTLPPAPRANTEPAEGSQADNGDPDRHRQGQRLGTDRMLLRVGRRSEQSDRTHIVPADGTRRRHRTLSRSVRLGEHQRPGGKPRLLLPSVREKRHRRRPGRRGTTSRRCRPYRRPTPNRQGSSNAHRPGSRGS